MTTSQNHNNNNDLYDILPFDRENGVPKDVPNQNGHSKNDYNHTHIVLDEHNGPKQDHGHYSNEDTHTTKGVVHSSHSPNHVHETHDISHGVETEEEQTGGSKILKGLMVIGILIILFFISIGIVKIVPKAIGSLSSASVYLSSIFSKEGIELSLDKTTVSDNESFTTSWKNTSKKEGVLVWSFTCTEGVTVLYRSVDGSMQPVICETSFPLPTDISSYPFTVKYSKDTDIKVPMTLSLFNRDTKELLFSDTNQITVTKDSVKATDDSIKLEEKNVAYSPSKVTETKETATSTNAKNTTNTQTTVVNTSVVGPTDMSINLVQVNAIEAGTFNVKNLTNVSVNDKVYIRFRVANLGTNKSGTWQLTGLLPTLVASDRAFVSKIEPSLNPGESHEMTMMFDSFDSSKNEIVITIENTNDTVSANNIIRIPIHGSGSNSSVNTSNNTNTGSRADLAVRILDIGAIDRYNNFYRTTSLHTDDEIAVIFEVENRGRDSSGYYELEVKVPTNDNDSRTFRSLTPLAGGAKTEFTVKFINADRGRGTISVEVDPDNDIRENSESNNKATRSITVNN